MSLKQHNKIKEILDGPVFTVFTAFNSSGDISYQQIEKYLNFLYSSGVRNFYVMPYNSRYSKLREKEIYELNRFVISAVKNLNNKNYVIVSDSIHGPSELSADIGFDAFEQGADMFASIVREKYFSDTQIINHYKFLSNKLNKPLLVHEMPFLSGYDATVMRWPLSLLKKLKEIENVLAIKEDAKDTNYGIKVIENLEPDIKVIFAGKKRFIKELYTHGLTSYLNGTSIVNPQIAFLFWEALKDKNKNQLDKILESIEDPFWNELVAKFGWHRSNKALLEAAGLMDRFDRLPMQHLESEDFEIVQKFYNENKETLLNPSFQ